MRIDRIKTVSFTNKQLVSYIISKSRMILFQCTLFPSTSVYWPWTQKISTDKSPASIESRHLKPGSTNADPVPNLPLKQTIQTLSKNIDRLVKLARHIQWLPHLHPQPWTIHYTDTRQEAPQPPAKPKTPLPLGLGGPT